LDDRQIAVIRYRSITDSELFLLDVNTGEQRRIEPADPATPTVVNTRRRGSAAQATAAAATLSVAQARFSRDGRGLFFISDRGGEFLALHKYDAYTRQLTTLTPDTNWDVERFELSEDGRFIAYTRNEGGVDRLVVHDLGINSDLL